MKYKIQRNMYSSSSYYVKDMILVNSFKRTLIKLTIYFAVAVAILLVTIVPHMFYTKTYIPHHRHIRYPTDLKYILFWNESKKHKGHFRKQPEFANGQKLFIQQRCPHINCYITYDKDALKEDHDFDAVVFDINEVKKMNLDALNVNRCPEQLYIFRSIESSEKNAICDHNFDNFFNLTWTYKLNSDIPQPFFNIHNINKTVIGPRKKMKWIEKISSIKRYSNKLKTKDKAVAWIINKCKLKSQHRDFIKEFKEELRGYNYSLDTYGPCGQNNCPGGKVFKCHKMIEKSYYFQLVLEDSFAEDYVTDGIVNAMTHLVIPIVYGSAHYKNFLPPGSYVNAQTFDVKKLGALVDYLIKKRDVYEYFFDWKAHYYYTANSKTSVCNLCAVLNESKQPKTYTYFRRWWNSDFKDTCQRMSLLHLFDDS